MPPASSANGTREEHAISSAATRGDHTYVQAPGPALSRNAELRRAEVARELSEGSRRGRPRKKPRPVPLIGKGDGHATPLASNQTVEPVTILRELWQRRLVVGSIALLSVAVGFVLVYRVSLPPESRSFTVGVAKARILVDTPRSQVIEVIPRGAETLGTRASVLANLMVDGDVKDSIARSAGLRPRQLVAGVQPADDAELRAAQSRADSFVLTTAVLINHDLELVELPIIEVEAQAPDVGRAARLANAAVKGLSQYLDSKAAVEGVAQERRLQVRALGGAQAATASRGPRRLIALAAALFVFVIGCAAVLTVSALVRAWRTADASESDDLGEIPPLAGDPALLRPLRPHKKGPSWGEDGSDPLTAPLSSPSRLRPAADGKTADVPGARAKSA